MNLSSFTQRGFSESLLTSQTPLEEFEMRFVQQAGKVYFANNSKEAAALINKIIKERGNGTSCSCSIKLMGTSEDLSDSIESTHKLRVNQKGALEIVQSVDVGITKADFALAETGSIVEISYDDGLRLLSSLPRIHIAVLESNTILHGVYELAPVIRSSLRPQLDHSQLPSITIIGGPSRTSDIEMKSVLGVHGPHEVHVVVVAIQS